MNKKLCWEKKYRNFTYGWDDSSKTSITINLVSIRISIRGYYIGWRR